MEPVRNFNLLTALVFILIWLGISAHLRINKKKSLVYLFFFTIFFIYIFKVLDYTIFQFQSLILLKQFMPRLRLQGQEAGEAVQLIPLVTLTLSDLKTSLLNILLTVPFGFGLPFITNFRLKKIMVIGFFFSIGIELVQYFTGIIVKITFRVADINDVIFNTLGIFVGYILFICFITVYRKVLLHLSYRVF